MVTGCFGVGGGDWIVVAEAQPGKIDVRSLVSPGSEAQRPACQGCADKDFVVLNRQLARGTDFATFLLHLALATCQCR